MLKNGSILNVQFQKIITSYHLNFTMPYIHNVYIINTFVYNYSENNVFFQTFHITSLTYFSIPKVRLVPSAYSHTIFIINVGE